MAEAYSFPDTIGSASNWRTFGEGALMGLAAALDGYLQGKRAAVEARDAREARLAEQAVQMRAQDIHERLGGLEHVFKMSDLSERGRIADQEDKTKRFVEMYTTDGKVRMMDMQTGREVDWRKYVSDNERAAVEDTNETRRDVADTEAAADVKVAETNLKGVQDTNQTRVQVAEIDASSAEQIAFTKYAATVDAVKEGGAQDRATLWEEYNISKQVREDKIADRAFVGLGNLTPTLQKEGRDWVLKVMNEVKSDKTYTDLVSSVRQWNTILSALPSVGKPGGMTDIALVNAFQRMIDPGVSVREGDVQLLRTTSAYVEQLRQQIENLKVPEGEEAKVLTPSARAGLIRTAQSILNGQIDAFYERQMTAANTLLQLEPELRDSGITFQQLIPQIFEKSNVNPYELAGMDRDKWPDTPEARVPGTSPEVVDAAELVEGGKTPTEAAQYAIDTGWTVEGLRNALTTAGRSAEYISAAEARFNAMQTDDADAPDEPETPETPNTQDAVPSPEKTMETLDTKYAEVSDIDLRRQMLADGYSEEDFENYYRWRTERKEGTDAQ